MCFFIAGSHTVLNVCAFLNVPESKTEQKLRFSNLSPSITHSLPYITFNISRCQPHRFFSPYFLLLRYTVWVVLCGSCLSESPHLAKLTDDLTSLSLSLHLLKHFKIYHYRAHHASLFLCRCCSVFDHFLWPSQRGREVKRELQKKDTSYSTLLLESYSALLFVHCFLPSLQNGTPFP